MGKFAKFCPYDFHITLAQINLAQDGDFYQKQMLPAFYKFPRRNLKVETSLIDKKTMTVIHYPTILNLNHQ